MTTPDFNTKKLKDFFSYFKKMEGISTRAIKDPKFEKRIQTTTQILFKSEA